MAEKYRVEITEVAERDAREIRDFIAQDKPGAADKWVRELYRQIESLEYMPQRHEVIPEAEDLGVNYRHIIFGNYRTIYRVERRRVLILRVIHGARLLDSSLLFGR